MSLRRAGTLKIASGASLLAGVVLGVLAGPGQQGDPSRDPRTVVCGDDCFPAAHPWLLILAAVFTVAGLLGLRAAFGKASR